MSLTDAALGAPSIVGLALAFVLALLLVVTVLALLRPPSQGSSGSSTPGSESLAQQTSQASEADTEPQPDSKGLREDDEAILHSPEPEPERHREQEASPHRPDCDSGSEVVLLEREALEEHTSEPALAAEEQQDEAAEAKPNPECDDPNLSAAPSAVTTTTKAASSDDEMVDLGEDVASAPCGSDRTCEVPPEEAIGQGTHGHVEVLQDALLLLRADDGEAQGQQQEQEGAGVDVGSHPPEHGQRRENNVENEADADAGADAEAEGQCEGEDEDEERHRLGLAAGVGVGVVTDRLMETHLQAEDGEDDEDADEEEGSGEEEDEEEEEAEDEDDENVEEDEDDEEEVLLDEDSSPDIDVDCSGDQIHILHHPYPVYRVIYRAGIHLCRGPGFQFGQAGAILQPGEIFAATATYASEDRRVYLRLADGRGWAYDDCEVEPEEPSLELIWERGTSSQVVLPAAGATGPRVEPKASEVRDDPLAWLSSPDPVAFLSPRTRLHAQWQGLIKPITPPDKTGGACRNANPGG